jgi:hypothetical protein
MILGPTTMDLIEKGRLSPLRVYAPPSVNLSGVKTRMGRQGRKRCINLK